jgi:phosphopantothenoylcysteine decarboxylase/phosphopantothenate--cysteine ligase
VSEAGGECFIGITGNGIAADKVGAVISDLAKAGNQGAGSLQPPPPESFTTPLTVALSICWQRAHPYRGFSAGSGRGRPLHLELGERAEVLPIAPQRPTPLAELAHGLADNLLTNTVLASTCLESCWPPAMNTEMWQQAAVQRNWQTLLEDPRYHSVGPGQGMLSL